MNNSIAVQMITTGPFQPVNVPLDVGGASRQAFALCRQLAAHGVRTRMTSGRYSREQPPQQMIENVYVEYMRTFWWVLGRRGFRALSKYLLLSDLFAYLVMNRHRYDIIHVHNMNQSAVTGVLVARLLNKPVIVKMTNSGYRNDIKRLFNRYGHNRADLMLGCLRLCDRVVVLNELAREDAGNYGFSDEQIVNIPNGIDIDGIISKRDYSISKPVRLVFSGRMEEPKGVDVILRALDILRKNRPDTLWRLTLLGSGSRISLYQTISQTTGVSDSVVFPGHIPDVIHELEKSDIFILPSRAEGMSNSLLEAMACGMPCIATDIPGNNDLVQNRYNGLLVEVDNEAGIADAVIRLADDAVLRKKLGQAARTTVEDRFSIREVALSYMRIYDRLINGPCPAKEK